MTDLQPRTPATDLRETLHRILTERVMVLDGAMGTMIQTYGLGEADFRGDRFADAPGNLKGDNELLNLTRPDIIADIHDRFFAAGADIVETNTFGATTVAQGDYEMSAIVRELNREGARLAREVADRWNAKTPGQPRFVAGAVGPTSKTLSLSEKVSDWVDLRLAAPAEADLVLRSTVLEYRRRGGVRGEVLVDLPRSGPHRFHARARDQHGHRGEQTIDPVALALECVGRERDSARAVGAKQTVPVELVVVNVELGQRRGQSLDLVGPLAERGDDGGSLGLLLGQ